MTRRRPPKPRTNLSRGQPGQPINSSTSRLGWEEIGRWPGALRFGPDDDRDEIFMLLAPL